MDSYLIDKTKITVLMPVYNCELYIKEAVESILNQTYSDFEFLIIDDCSTDKTLQICESFQDERIIIIEKEKNGTFIPICTKNVFLKYSIALGLLLFAKLAAMLL